MYYLRCFYFAIGFCLEIDFLTFLQVTVSDESGKLVAVKARDMGDGRYSASYMLRDPVLYTVRAHLNGRELDTSPFTHDMRVCREGKKPGVS